MRPCVAVMSSLPSGCDDRESPEPFVVFVDVEAFLGEFECGARVAFL